MSELADEAEALQANLDGLKNLGDSLKTFNESFASWLYVMNMNALTTDWPQVRAWQILFSIDRQLMKVAGRLLRTRRLRWHREERVLFDILSSERKVLMDEMQKKTLELL
jgi:hypothetical protein